MTLPAWYHRMNRRERLLASGVAGVIFILINLFIVSGLLDAIKGAHARLAEQRSARKAQDVFLKETGMWEKRQAWLKKHQPASRGPEEASKLLDRIKQVAAKREILISNPAIGTGDATPNYQSVYASIETQSPWPPLVRFLYDIQKPEDFIVFEDVNLAIDGTDKTVMKGRFKIAKWFAPPGGQQP